MLKRLRSWVHQPISPELLALLLALYFSVFLNDPLWQAITAAQQSLAGPQQSIFIVGSWIGITGFQVALISLLLWGRLTKALAITVTAITVVAHFFNVRYGIMYDVSMMRNVLATHPAEASELLTPGLAWHLVAYGLMPIGLIAASTIAPRTFMRSIAVKFGVVVMALVISFAVIALNYKNFSSSMRNHKEIRHLVLPASPTLSLIRTVGANEIKFPADKEQIDGPVAMERQHPRALLTVIVVGESVRAQNWGLSGYERQTTPQLAQVSRSELFNFPYLVTCGTNTEVSVPCMFSVFGRRHYDEQKIRKTESVLELLHRSGVATTWVDNQSGCKGTCTNIPSYMASDLVPRSEKSQESLDGILPRTLDRAYRNDANDQLIVMHMLGNHGPAYSRRYPKEMARFHPACDSNELANCSNEAIRNAYDNVIIYTDAILTDMIRRLRTIKTHDVALIYVSDHGESLGEHGIYLHGLPYAIAPAEQTRVPAVIWLPPATQKRLGNVGDCLARKAASPSHHDFLAHTLMGIYGLRSSAYAPALDWLHGCAKAPSHVSDR
jgi:lipid A ethanolaminephosphotransferase